jgi:RimJ/RimL family protein N-acetyltransferase
MTNFADLHLSTPRLHLRPIGPADAQALYGIFSDPVVMRYWSTPPWASIEFAHEWIARDMQTMAAGEHLRLGIVERAGGALLGSCSLFHLAPTCRRAEVGYGLAQAAWGKGYVQEAVGALLRHGFAAMDLNRVEADIDPRNTASARSLERLGFRREGLLRERWIVAGEVSDSALYGLLRADWQARQG